MPLHCKSAFAVCNLSVKPVVLIYTSALVQLLSLVIKEAVLFCYCDFFIIGIYLRAVTLVQSVLAASLDEEHAAFWQSSGRNVLPSPCSGAWYHAKHKDRLQNSLGNSVSTESEFKKANMKKKAFFLSWQIDSSCSQLHNALDAIFKKNILISVAD